jgi:hypothetical protein
MWAEGTVGRDPGTPISRLAFFRPANREIGVPGLEADFQAGADAGWGRHGGSRE